MLGFKVEWTLDALNYQKTELSYNIHTQRVFAIDVDWASFSVISLDHA